MPQDDMGGPPLVNSLLAVIPDVLSSLDRTIKGAAASHGAASVKDVENNDAQARGAFALLGLLRGAVHSVRDVVNSNSEHMRGDVLKPLYDGVECCRLLASAAALDLTEDARQDAPLSCIPFSSRRGVGATRITRNIMDAIHFLCEHGVA